MVFSGELGAEVRLGELGEVVEVFDDPWDQVEHEGVRAGRLVIKKTSAEDSLEITDAVVAFVEQERQRVPPGVELFITEDSSQVLRGQIALVVTNGWQGMILVALSLWLFFTLRLAWWVVMGVPVSVLGACLLMPELGLTINMLTLIGFLLALGLLMDDAIVIAENIATHRNEGKSAMQAAIDGTSEVKVGVISSFFTTVCVLGPLAMISGDSGQRLRVIPIVLITVMAVSLIEAFFILPGHLGHALHGSDPSSPGRFRRTFDGGMDFVRETLVGKTVDLALRWRYVTVSLVLGGLLACLGLLSSGRIPSRAMPDLQGDTIVAKVLMTQGTPLERTRSVVEQVVGGLHAMNAEWTPEQPGGEPLLVTWSVRYGQNSEAFETGSHVATISADLRTVEERNGSTDEFLATWKERTGPVADAVSVVFTTPGVGDGPKPIELRFGGEDLAELDRVATEVATWLARYDGTRNLLTDLRPGKPELLVSLLPGAFGLGLDAESISRQVTAAFRGSTVDELQIGPETVEVQVRFAPASRASKADLDQLRVPLKDGTLVPLQAIARVEEGRGYGRIVRIDGARTVTVRGDVDYSRGNATQILGAFHDELLPELDERHPTIQVSAAGEAKDTAQTQASMGAAMLMGLLGVFALLSFQFRSYVEPFVVMAAIPLSLIGVILGHLLLDFPFTLPSILGFISLAGIVVNDSILLVEFVRKARREGADVLAAASQASRARFRAVLLTSSTTVAGLLPLLLETSLQAQILKGPRDQRLLRDHGLDGAGPRHRALPVHDPRGLGAAGRRGAGRVSAERARRQHGYPVLLGLLVVNVLLGVLTEQSVVRVGMVAAILGTAAWSSSRRSSLRAAGFVMAGVVASMPFLSEGIGGPALVLGSSYAFFVTGVVLRDVLGDGDVNLCTVCGALASFLLLTVAFGLVFGLVEFVAPGSFEGLPTGAGEALVDVQALQYFSVMTITTVGYGDVTPVSQLARSLAAIEALIGQFFLVVLVARLVALEVAGAQRARERED